LRNFKIHFSLREGYRT